MNSRANCSRVPMVCVPGMTTSNSPAIRLRQANAHPCLKPATTDGIAAGTTKSR